MSGTVAGVTVEDVGDVALDEPWHARVVALALEAVNNLGLDWEDFRVRLIAAIAEDEHRPYYDSWLIALERLAMEEAGTSASDLTTNRMRAASYWTEEERSGDLEVFPIACDEVTLLSVLTELFENWWQHIRFGTLIDGAVYELRAPDRPRLSMLDGYLTIDFGSWHVHVCIGEHVGVPGRGVDPRLARRRRCAHAELQRQWVDGAPRVWMFRMFNGDGAQQMTVLLPNPFLDDDQHVLPTPDWSRLALWDLLRERYLGLTSDPLDRTADGLRHP